MNIWKKISDKVTKKSAAITDLEDVFELSLAPIELELPDPKSFIKKELSPLCSSCKLDKFNKSSMDKYINAYGKEASDIEAKVANTKQAAERLIDEYSHICKDLEGETGIILRKKAREKQEKKKKKEFLDSKLALPFWLDDSNQKVIIGVSAIAEVCFLFTLIHSILLESWWITMIVTVSAVVPLVLLPIFISYELAAVVKGNSENHKYSKMKIQWIVSISAYVVLFLGYAVTRFAGIDMLQEYSTSPRSSLIILTVFLIILPFINSTVVYKVHFFTLTTDEVKAKKQLAAQYDDERRDAIKNSLLSIDEYADRIWRRCQEIEKIAYAQLENWTELTKEEWKLFLSIAINADAEAVDEINQ